MHSFSLSILVHLDLHGYCWHNQFYVRFDTMHLNRINLKRLLSESRQEELIIQAIHTTNLQIPVWSIGASGWDLLSTCDRTSRHIWRCATPFQKLHSWKLHVFQIYLGHSFWQSNSPSLLYLYTLPSNVPKHHHLRAWITKKKKLNKNTTRNTTSKLPNRESIPLSRIEHLLVACTKSK